MKLFAAAAGILVLLSIFPIPNIEADLDPTQMLKQMDYVLRGNSSEITATLDVKTAHWQRNYKMHIWMKNLDFAFARLLEPAKVEGQGFLRIQFRVWNYLPTAERVLLLPLSLMSEPALGSDFSTDDFVKLSYLPRDYDAVILGEETMDDFETYHLELKPHPDAPVTYEKLDLWLRTQDSAPVCFIFYNEKLQPLRTLHFSEFKLIGDIERPTVWRMENNREEGRETILTLVDAQFDIEIPDSLFTRENLEKYP